jgi:CheY-like chemotaxis protein
VRTLLFESVRELLFNAVKHAHVDRVALDLTLDADDRLCITVSDDGIGFDPAALENRSKEGEVGWGLFSIRERLALLGGHLDIESATGKGTRFRLVAPRGRESEGAAANPSSPDHILPASAVHVSQSAEALRILIVDDHAGVRVALRQLLSERPQFLVVGDAANGIEAIAQTRTLVPNAIVMDVSMPEMDGIEATRRIRAESPEIQIFGLSMEPRPTSIHPIVEAGAAEFFVKGVDTQRLIDRLLTVHALRGGSSAEHREHRVS